MELVNRIQGVDELFVVKYVMSNCGWDRKLTSYHSVISPFVFTRELMPVLNRTAAEPNSDVRVIVVRRVYWHHNFQYSTHALGRFGSP